MDEATWFRDPEGRLRTVWRLILFFPVWIVLQLILGIPTLIVVGLFLRAEAPHVAFVVLVPVLTAVSFALVWAFRTALDRRDPAGLGLRSPDPRPSQSPWVGLAAGICMAGVPFLLLLATGRLTVEGIQFSPLALVLLPVLLIAAFHEELVFRGYALQNIRESGHPAAAVLVTAVLFLAIHGANPHFWSQPVGAGTIFTAGLLLGTARLLSGNLWFPTALHFAWNAVQGPVFGVPISGFQMEGFLRVSGTAAVTKEFGLEGSPLGLGATLAATALFLALLLRRRADDRPGAPTESAE
jgi:membrane protease YdiL (CAAX protease family)